MMNYRCSRCGYQPISAEQTICPRCCLRAEAVANAERQSCWARVVAVSQYVFGAFYLPWPGPRAAPTPVASLPAPSAE